MQSSFKQWFGRLLVVATAIAAMTPVIPASAALPTDVSDTLTRQKVSTAATHTLVATFPAGTWDNTETVTVSYSGPAFALADSTPACALGVGTCTAAVVAATDVLTITCTAGGGCSGLLTLGTFTGTNPGSAGSKTITIAGSGGISGTFAVPIVDDDQVSVTATVDPSITFDIDTATTDTESPAAYTVALGTITTSNSKVSGGTDSVNFIWLDLDTNASGGAVVTVQNANGANGIASTSVPADDIDSTSAVIANGTENYGICVVTATDVGAGAFTEVAPFNNADCTADEQTPSVGGLDGTAQAVVNTGGNPIATGRVQITVAAAISGLTEAHTDYTDTLTFIATGTF
jgi:hypothetical protein